MHRFDRFSGSIIAGAIGDGMGSASENQVLPTEKPATFVWAAHPDPLPGFMLTDDTQLTLATCEALVEANSVSPQHIAQKFLDYAQKGKLSGLGSATLQAINGLRNGGHWALVGKKGDQAAGNGAAMRIAPLAFWPKPVTRETIRDVCRITHHHDEAYVGALAVTLAIRGAFEHSYKLGKPTPKEWLESIGNSLPDTLVRDRILELSQWVSSKSIAAIAAEFGNSGYVVESVPLALFGVAKSWEIGLTSAMERIIQSGGDTDTNASMLGQVAGAYLGQSGIPPELMNKIIHEDAYIWIQSVLNRWKPLYS